MNIIDWNPEQVPGSHASKFTEYPLIHTERDHNLENRYVLSVICYLPELVKTPILVNNDGGDTGIVQTEAGDVEAWAIIIDYEPVESDQGPFWIWKFRIEYELESSDNPDVHYVDVQINDVSQADGPETSRGTVTTPKTGGVGQT